MYGGDIEINRKTSGLLLTSKNIHWLTCQTLTMATVDHKRPKRLHQRIICTWSIHKNILKPLLKVKKTKVDCYVSKPFAQAPFEVIKMATHCQIHTSTAHTWSHIMHYNIYHYVMVHLKNTKMHWNLAEHNLWLRIDQKR